MAVAGGFFVPFGRQDIVGAIQVGEAPDAALGTVRDAVAGAVQHPEMKLGSSVFRLGGKFVQSKGPRVIPPGRPGAKVERPTHLICRLHVVLCDRGSESLQFLARLIRLAIGLGIGQKQIGSRPRPFCYAVESALLPVEHPKRLGIGLVGGEVEPLDGFHPLHRLKSGPI